MRKAVVTDEDWALVPLVLAAEKKIIGSARDLLYRLRGYQEAERNANRSDWVHDQILKCDAQIVTVRLRICGSLRCSIAESWKASIIVFGERIDGIDHHVRAPDGRGGVVHGWHRHEWDAAKRSCKHYRNHLSDFDPKDDMREFLLLCCERFGVKLEQEVGE